MCAFFVPVMNVWKFVCYEYTHFCTIDVQLVTEGIISFLYHPRNEFDELKFHIFVHVCDLIRNYYKYFFNYEHMLYQARIPLNPNLIEIKEQNGVELVDMIHTTKLFYLFLKIQSNASQKLCQRWNFCMCLQFGKVILIEI